MDQQTLIEVLYAFTLAQCQMLQMLDALMNNNKQVIDVEEMVAMFLHILAHDVKNHVIQREFVRLDCLEALDKTYIKVNIHAADRPMFRTHKEEIVTNVLDICDIKGDFIYVLASWEGSAPESRISRDAFARPNGLQVPKGYYYLCDAGYPNTERFLTSYRGQRYHLQEWCGAGNAPTNAKEYFNMKHYSTRNVIERVFDLLKGRWTILHTKSYYPLQVQCRTILACCLLDNLINKEMPNCDDIDDFNEGDSAYTMTNTREYI
ncbi:retrotransposon protein [Cucumis melo var. makuwa]|uniref:Retrotransposon protein n=1 Tax=Cucumis melo var. makuwa TaxID=1194695 RepID=A0A5A7VJR7_CUCMM|nr:retrotransposon protein [Cucumis melo var. makuwa]